MRGGFQSLGREINSLDAFAGMKGKIDIAGGTAHIPVMKDAAKRIMQAHPGIRISVAAGGSGVGVQKVGEGLVEIGNTGRPLSAEEIAKYGLKSFAFAIDGVAVAVHPKNPVSALSAAQVQDIFAGKVNNWKHLGGRDAAIHLFTRDEASGTREVFWEKLLKKGNGTAELKTVNGQPLWILNNGPHNIQLKDGKGNIANISTYDVQQKNGVIDVIDTVLMPK